MKEALDISNSDIDQLFDRYNQAPESKVFVLLADACRKIGRADEALEICEKGIAIHPTYASGHVVKGKCLYDLDRHDRAQKAFEEVLTYDGDNLVALKYLGMIEAQAERYESARDYLTHILRIDPDNAEITEALAHIATHDDDEREAHEAAPTVESVDSDEEPAVLQVSDDVMWADEASSGDDEPKNKEEVGELATMTLADIYAEQGYTNKALKIYKEILLAQPDNDTVKTKIAALNPSSETVDTAGAAPVSTDSTPVATNPEPTAPAAENVQRGENKTSPPPKPKRSSRRRNKPGPKASATADDERSMDHFNQWLASLRK